MSKVIVFDPLGGDRQRDLESVCDRAGVKMSELLRRLVDYGLRDDSLNMMFPRLSGQLSVGK